MVSVNFCKLQPYQHFYFVSKTNLFEIGGDGKDVGGIKEKSQGVNKIYIYCPYMDLFFQLPKAVNSLKVLAELPIIVVLMYQVR